VRISQRKRVSISSILYSISVLDDHSDGWSIERQKEQALDALRCPDADAKVENLSGGERRRIALARLFLQRPDVLMLDEISNSLDALSCEWIEDFLRKTESSVVLVTHDRLLMQCTGWTLELSPDGAKPVEGMSAINPS